MQDIAPPPRTRRRKKNTVEPYKAAWNVKVIGGPKTGFNSGFPIFENSKSVTFIGYRLTEFKHDKTGKKLFYAGTDTSVACHHAWRFVGGALKYVGKFRDKQSAVTRIRALFIKQQADEKSSEELQRVAPPPRRRSSKVA